MTTPPVIQVYSQPKAAGGEPRGPLPLTPGRVVEATKGERGVSFTAARNFWEQSGGDIGDCVRLYHPRRGISEWIITGVVRSSGIGQDTVTVNAGPVRRILALRGDVRVINTAGPPTLSFSPGAQTVTTLLNQYVLTNRVADGLAWLQLGTIEYVGTIDIGTFTGVTRGEILDRIERATGYRVVLRRLEDDSAYLIDVVRNENPDAAVQHLSVGKNLRALVQTKDLTSSASVIAPKTSGGLAMAETSWRVRGNPAAGWWQLEDPAGGPAVVREDDQFVGQYLVPLDAPARVIIGSRASDSAVQVSDSSGLAVGAMVTFWETAAGALPGEIASPAGLASSIGRVVAPVVLSSPYNERNLLPDPLFAGRLQGWREFNPSNGGAELFSRADASTAAGEADGITASGSSAIAVRDFPANYVFRLGQPVYVRGVVYEASTAVVVDGTGTATIPVTGGLLANVANDETFTWKRPPSSVSRGSPRAAGAQTSGAANLVLDGFTPSTMLSGGSLRVTTGANHRINVTAISGVAPNWVLNIDPLSVDLPAATELTITETQATVGQFDGFAQLFTWRATVDSLVAAGGTSVAVTATVTRVIPSNGAQFVNARSNYNNTIERTYTMTSSPAWDTSGSATPSVTPNVVDTIPAGAEIRWSNGTTVFGTLTTNGAIAGASAIQLNAGAFANIIPAGDTFSLPAFTMYASAQATMNSSGAGSVPVIKGVSDTVPSNIADGTVIETRICPDFFATDFGGDGVLRIRGSNSTEPTYQQSGRYLIYSPVARVLVPAGEQKTFRFALGVTRWAAERIFSTADDLFIQLWDADSREKLAMVQMSSAMTDPIPFEIDGSTWEHLTVPLSYTLTQTRRLEVCIAPLSGYAGARGAFLFLRWAFKWTGGADVPPVVGSHSNPGHHRAQDILEACRNAARYTVQFDPERAGSEPIVLDGYGRIVDELLGIDTTQRIQRIQWATHNENDLTMELATVAPRQSVDAFRD